MYATRMYCVTTYIHWYVCYCLKEEDVEWMNEWRYMKIEIIDVTLFYFILFFEKYVYFFFFFLGRERNKWTYRTLFITDGMHVFVVIYSLSKYCPNRRILFFLLSLKVFIVEILRLSFITNTNWHLLIVDLSYLLFG